MKKYYIRTFGCQMNKAESEKIAASLEKKGYKPAQKIEEADVVVINTCSVRQSAEDRVLGLVKNLKQKKRPKIILTGCMLYHSEKWLKKKLPGVDKIAPLAELIKPAMEPKRKDTGHAWVPIMKGCNHFCAYCVVPYARGREKSRPFKEIICEVEKLAKKGYQQITLLGQNVNSYQPSFAKLLRRLHQIRGIKKISFITSNPWDLTDEIIKAMKLSQIDRYLHLPVQSGDDEILRRMNRPYKIEQYIKLVEKIRRQIPDIKIGTDIIVGFPGETKKAFEKTLKLCQRVGFEKAYIAIYSPRPGTAAYKMKDNVSYPEKKRRWKILDSLINRSA